MAKTKINKLEGAQKQIDAAIRMLFRNEDPVAIYPLAAASWQVLRDLARAQGESQIEQAFEQIIGPETTNDLWRKIREPANFLKHADRDPEGISEGIEEEANDHVLLMASLYYWRLAYQFTTEMSVLIAWLSKRRLGPERRPAPQSLLEHVNPAVVEAVDDSIHTLPRKAQLEHGLEVLQLALCKDQSRPDS